MNNAPTTRVAIRIATLFRRKLTTAWTPAEINKYKQLVKAGCFDDLDDLRLVETYYIFNTKKPDNYLRRDLQTFLNNYQSEVDRARLWAEHNKAKVKRARPIVKGDATDEDFAKAGELAKQEMIKLKEKLFPKGAKS